MEGVRAQEEPGLWVTVVVCHPPTLADLLRVRQEVAAAAVRSPSGLEVHLPSSTAGQRRKQGLAQHREGTTPAGAPSFSERYWGACISKRIPYSLCSFLGHRAGVGRSVTWFLQAVCTACTSTPIRHLYWCTLPSPVTATRPCGYSTGVCQALYLALRPCPVSWAEVQENIPGVGMCGVTAFRRGVRATPVSIEQLWGHLNPGGPETAEGFAPPPGR